MERDPTQRELDERTRRDLTRLADGSLKDRPRAQLDGRLAGSSSLRAALHRQRAGAAALGTLELEAPASLRARLAVQAARPARVAAARSRRRARRLALGGGLAG